MGNIESYVKWRGDLSFEEKPFCEVDNLIFSELAYIDFAGIVPTVEQGGSITLKEAAGECLRQNRTATCMFGPTQKMLSAMADSKRFSDVRLTKFEEILDPDRQMAFAALCFEMEDGNAYIAYRGTSDSLVGWREDFNMSFELVPAQMEAAVYLNRVMPQLENGVYVGGHSKGGNLAVYAAMCCDKSQQDKICAVYDNDGPGFCMELIDRGKYQMIQPKILHIVPEFCVIGALFRRSGVTKIVASDASGLLQHGGMSWQVEGDCFIEMEAHSDQCRLINEIFDTWIESADMEQRKAFVQDFFDALEASGAKGLSDLTKIGIDGLETILLKLTAGSEKNSKIVTVKLFASAVDVIRHFDFVSFLKTKYAIRGILCFLIGLFLMITPDVSSKGMGIGLGVALLIFTGKRIIKTVSSYDVQSRLHRYKLISQMVFMCLTAFFTAVLNLVFHFAGIMVGIFFLCVSFNFLKNSFVQSCPRKQSVLLKITAAISFMMGIVPFVSPVLLLSSYAFAAGTFILIYGTSYIVYALYLCGRETGKA